jgi:hypothetical protein
MYKQKLAEFDRFEQGIGTIMTLVNLTTGNTAKPFIRDMSKGPNSLKEAMKELKT